MDIVLIRHGASPSNNARRYLGRVDEPLSPRGVEQARFLASRGVLPPVERVVCSPLRRCAQTAAILFPRLVPEPEPAFIELDFGAFEGKTHNELLRREPAYAAWLASRGTSPIPGGEDMKSLRKRAREAFLAHFARGGAGESAAIVAHGGVIMALLAELARPRREFYDCFVPNCGVVLCGWNGEFLSVEGGDLK